MNPEQSKGIQVDGVTSHTGKESILAMEDQDANRFTVDFDVLGH